MDGQAANIGEFVQLTDGAGNSKGRVKINADGTVDFDADGDGDGVSDFEALGNGDVEEVSIDYTIGTADTPPTTTTTNFQQDFDGATAGTQVSTQFDGFSVIATRDGDTSGTNAAMIFDSDNPTGGDSDLGVNRGMILIISEDDDSNDPDDNAAGGTIEFTFDQPTFVDEMRVVDIDYGESVIFRLFDDQNNLITLIDGGDTGNGGQKIVQLDTDGVSRMEVELSGSGGLDLFAFSQTVTEQGQPGASDSATVTVKVQGINDLEDGDEAETVNEDSGVTTFAIDALENTTDPEAGDPSVTQVTNGVDTVSAGTQIAGDNGGLFTIASDGTVTFDTNGDFEALNNGDQAVTKVTYTVEDAAGDTVTSTHTVTVNGEDDAVFSLTGTVLNEADATRSLTFIVDHSITTFGTAATGAPRDLNGDASFTVIDALLEQIVDSVQGFDASQQVNFIVAGLSGEVSSGQITAGAIQGAAGSANPEGALSALFNPIFGLAAGGETELDIAKALDEAKADITATDANGADIDDIIVLTTTTGVADFTIDPVTGDIVPLPYTDPTAVVNALTDASGIDADIDVVLINSDDFAFPQILESVDADGITSMIDDGGTPRFINDADPFGLDSLITPDEAISLGDVVSVSIDGVDFAVTDESADPGFQFTINGLAADPNAGLGISVNVDEDNDPATIERVENVTATLVPGSTDAFEFVLDLA